MWWGGMRTVQEWRWWSWRPQDREEGEDRNWGGRQAKGRQESKESEWGTGANGKDYRGDPIWEPMWEMGKAKEEDVNTFSCLCFLTNGNMSVKWMRRGEGVGTCCSVCITTQYDIESFNNFKINLLQKIQNSIKITLNTNVITLSYENRDLASASNNQLRDLWHIAHQKRIYGECLSNDAIACVRTRNIFKHLTWRNQVCTVLHVKSVKNIHSLSNLFSFCLYHLHQTFVGFLL